MRKIDGIRTRRRRPIPSTRPQPATRHSSLATPQILQAQSNSVHPGGRVRPAPVGRLRRIDILLSLAGGHPNGTEPGFDELRPFGDGQIRGAQAEAVVAVRVEVHFGRHAGLFESDVISECLFHTVDVVVLGLEQKCGRHVFGDRNFGIQLIFVRGVLGHVAGIQRDGEIRAAAFAIGGIDGRVGAMIGMGADVGDEVAAGGKAEHADFVRINMPFGGVVPNEAEGALRIFQSGRRDGFEMFVEAGDIMRAGSGHAVFQQHGRDAAGGEPIADFRAFEVDGQNGVAAAWKDNDGDTDVRTLGRIDRHGRLGHVLHGGPGFAADEVCAGLEELGTGGLKIRRRVRPDGYLGVAGRLPEVGLRAQRRECAGEQKSEKEWLHRWRRDNCGDSFLSVIVRQGDSGLMRARPRVFWFKWLELSKDDLLLAVLIRVIDYAVSCCDEGSNGGDLSGRGSRTMVDGWASQGFPGGIFSTALTLLFLGLEDDSDMIFARLFRRKKKANAPASGADVNTDAQEFKGPRKKILVVDDDPVMVKTLSMTLNPHGYKVLAAKDGAEAIALMRQEKPDMLLVDVHLPPDGPNGASAPWNGFQLTRWLQHVNTVKIPLIFMSGSDKPEFKAQAAAIGADGFMPKPINSSALLSSIDSALSRPRQGGEFLSLRMAQKN